jgi:hypothetical protein
MNVVVNKARHPQLANYIHSSLFALLPYIQKVRLYLPFLFQFYDTAIFNFKDKMALCDSICMTSISGISGESGGDILWPRPCTSGEICFQFNHQSVIPIKCE